MFYEFFNNSDSVIGSKIASFRAKYHINFTTSTRSRIMSSICVTMCLLKSKKLVLTICFPSYPSDPTSHL